MRFSPGVKFLGAVLALALLGGGWLIIDRAATPTVAQRTVAVQSLGVDAVIREVLVATARLDNYAEVAADRRAVVLQRASENLTRAAHILATDALPGVPQVQSQQAEDEILELADRLDRMLQCVQASAAQPVEAAPVSGDPCSDPALAAEDAAAVAAVATRVADLRPYGVLSEPQVREYASTVAAQAQAEGATGSTTTIDEPTR